VGTVSVSPENLDIRRVRCFVAAFGKSGFVRATVSRLDMSQPALSRRTGLRKQIRAWVLCGGTASPTA